MARPRSSLSTPRRAALLLAIAAASAVPSARGAWADRQPAGAGADRQGHRVLLVASDAAVVAALERSLASVGGTVVQAAAPVPQLPDDAIAALDAAQADYVVWVGDGAAVIFRRETRGFVHRPAATSPGDAAAAAAVALTIRTALQLPSGDAGTPRTAGQPARATAVPSRGATTSPSPTRHPGSPWSLALGVGLETPVGGLGNGLMAHAHVAGGRRVSRGWHAGAMIDVGRSGSVRDAGAEVRRWDAEGGAFVEYRSRMGKVELGPRLSLGVGREQVEAQRSAGVQVSSSAFHLRGVMSLIARVDVAGKIQPFLQVALKGRIGGTTLEVPRGNSDQVEQVYASAYTDAEVVIGAELSF